MDRMTTDNEKHGLFFLNTFYGKDGQAMVRGGGPAPGYEDCTLVDFLSRAATPLGLSLDEEDPETVGEIMYDNLQFGPMECEGVLGFLWLAAVQATEMRGRLKMIENILGDNYDLARLRELVEADREGRCVVLDVKIGQKVWILDAGDYGDDDEAYPLELNINGITLSDEHEIYYFIESPLGMDVDPFSHKDIGKTVFLTRADAEAALRREQDGN